MMTREDLLSGIALDGPCNGPLDVMCSRSRIREAIEKGDYPDAVRLLRNGYFPCLDGPPCQDNREMLLINLVAEVRADLLNKWRVAGLETGLSINFVCTNPVKLRAPQGAAMEVGDIVPMAFNMRDVSTPGQMVVQVEI